MTIRYVIVSIVSGLLFGLMDGLINANPLAVKLYVQYPNRSGYLRNNDRVNRDASSWPALRINITKPLIPLP